MDLNDNLVRDLLLRILEKTGKDFREYRSGTINRRISRRMALTDVNTLEDYLNVLQNHPSEFEHLVHDLTIKVSHFFRNPYVFELMDLAVWPPVLEAAKKSRHIRIWSAGCANGEETYSLAMSILDHLERKKIPRADIDITIIGTDIDDQALNAAKRGRYGSSALGETKKRIFEKFFVAGGNYYEVIPEIKNIPTFTRHDLTSHVTISPSSGVVTNYDLIFCRNVLIYFTAPLQERVLLNFWKILNPNGFVILGESEGIPLSVSKYLGVFDQRGNIYRKIGE